MDILLDKWDDILDKVKEDCEMSPVSFNTWLKPLKVKKYDEDMNKIYILVPSSEMELNYISKKYINFLRISIAEITGIECEIEFILPQQAKKMDDEAAAKTAAPSFKTTIDESNLNPKYTFDTFVVGSNNRFAHAASLSVAESPGDHFNPLFLYGGVGLGKTHLMHSIAHYILDKNPSMKVLYVSSEDFTNELIRAIKNSSPAARQKFRDKYRNIDVLLIDDIQFIIGKESTQEEFFHTFNALHGAKKQIIISSDRPPKEMVTLEARLMSRFEWGIIADISSPDYETRMAILKKKEEMDGFRIKDEVIEYIATNIKSNIRELEGALNTLMAVSRLEKKSTHEIDVPMAEEALKNLISPNQKKEITPELILSTVAEHYSVSVADIKGSKRNADIVLPRQVAMYLCRTMTETSLEALGLLMGKRDHSTVLNGYNKIKDKIDTSESLRNNIEVIKKKLSSG